MLKDKKQVTNALNEKQNFFFSIGEFVIHSQENSYENDVQNIFKMNSHHYLIPMHYSNLKRAPLVV